MHLAIFLLLAFFLVPTISLPYPSRGGLPFPLFGFRQRPMQSPQFGQYPPFNNGGGYGQFSAGSSGQYPYGPRVPVHLLDILAIPPPQFNGHMAMEEVDILVATNLAHLQTDLAQWEVDLGPHECSKHLATILLNVSLDIPQLLANIPQLLANIPQLAEFLSQMAFSHIFPSFPNPHCVHVNWPQPKEVMLLDGWNGRNVFSLSPSQIYSLT